MNERMKELKIMKALRYLLIVMGLMSVLSISAQALAQKPEAQMQSTSVMPSAGSTLPSAAATGAVVTGEQPGTYTPANTVSNGPRRARKGLDDGDDDIGGGSIGQPFPIGDAIIPLALLALAFAFGKWIARTKPLR